jgi:DNA modification methylase
MIDGIKTLGITDFELLGLDGFSLPEVIEPKCDEDEVPEQVDTRCKLGDVWALGRHRLMCGDSTDPKCWDAIRVGDQTMVFTSPPYGLGDGAKLRDKYVKGAPKLKSLYNEHTDDITNWLTLMNDWTALALVNSKSLICNVQMLAQNKRDMWSWLSNYLTHMVDIVIWDKGHGPPQMQKNVLTNAFEFMFILSSEENASRTFPMANFHGNQPNVVRVGASKNNEFADVHKATMPIELAEWAINMSPQCDSIIDPFGGTGTTMIAAHKHNKTAGLIELDPHYCDVILARWEKYTGKLAERVNG